MARRITALTPSTAQIGLPAGTKEAGQRADFRPDIFDLNIETHGYRLAWTRASFCPCVPLNNQTEQANPTCALCRGTGFVYFGDRGTQSAATIGGLTDLQQSIITRTGASVIRGLMTGIGRREQQYTDIGHYVEGEANVTVRPLNTLGRLDRLVQIDSIVVYTQKILSGDPAAPLALRYPVLQMNLLAAQDASGTTVRYIQGQDFDLVMGNVVWRSGRAPARGTNIAAHYNTFPTWLVVDQPHSVRIQNILNKVTNPLTPQGDLLYLPLQANVRLEWLVGQNDAETLI